jgi:hypothetical protein
MSKLGVVWAGLRTHWQVLLGLVGGVLILLFRLTTLPVTGKLSMVEFVTGQQNGTLHGIIKEPLFLPYDLLQWAATSLLPGHAVLATRLPSVLFGITSLLAMTYIGRRWYGQRTVIFGFIVLVTSAAFLHSARLGTYDIVYFAALPLLLAAHIALLHGPRRFWSLVCWLLVSLFLVYIPGMVWFVVLQAVWQRSLLIEAFQQLGGWLKTGALVIVSLLGLAPLVYGFVAQDLPGYVATWLGLPTSIPAGIEIAKNAAAALLFVWARTPSDPVRWLGELPLFGAFLLLCLVAGIIFYAQHWRAERTQLLASISLVTLALLAAGGPVVRSLAVPVAYLVAFAGLAYVLHFWLRLFPNNQTARRLGIGLVCVALGLTTVYNLRHYFVAWPHTPETEQAFNLDAAGRRSDLLQ